MKSSIRDKTEGMFHEAKGKVRVIAGKLSNNFMLEAKGTGERIAGKAQIKFGQLKKMMRM